MPMQYKYVSQIKMTSRIQIKLSKYTKYSKTLSWNSFFHLLKGSSWPAIFESFSNTRFLAGWSIVKCLLRCWLIVIEKCVSLLTDVIIWEAPCNMFWYLGVSSFQICWTLLRAFVTFFFLTYSLSYL